MIGQVHDRFNNYNITLIAYSATLTAATLRYLAIIEDWAVAK